MVMLTKALTGTVHSFGQAWVQCYFVAVGGHIETNISISISIMIYSLCQKCRCTRTESPQVIMSYDSYIHCP